MGEGVNDAQTYHDHTPICVINSLGITKVTEKKRKKEWLVFFLLMLIGLTFGILFAFDVFL